MPEVKTTPVHAKRVEDIDADDAPPGSFEYHSGTKGDGRVCGMIYICPCGCGHQGLLEFRRDDRPEFHPSWEWNGNHDAPTLTPSVHHIGHWHGWLKSGVWESC